MRSKALVLSSNTYKARKPIAGAAIFLDVHVWLPNLSNRIFGIASQLLGEEAKTLLLHILQEAIMEASKATAIHEKHFRVQVGKQFIDLPIVPVGDTLAISLLMTIDAPISFIEAAAKELAEALSANDGKPEVVATAATLGIPVGWAVARTLGLDHVIVLQKTKKIHLEDALVEPVSSITTDGEQVLRLDRARIPDIKGRSTVFVDDVISSGASTAASLRLLRRAGANVVGAGVLLTEGEGWRKRLGDQDAALVTALGKIPLFRPAEGGWTEDWSC